MKEFIRKHEARIHGVLSCFDRMLFRGYLPIMSGWSMAQFLNGLEVNGSSLKPFLLENAERVKDHAIAMAKKHERPFQYLASNIRKEDTARKLAERDGIEEGLVCIFSLLEPCRTFSFCFQKERPYVQSARRKCLHLYFYFMDREPHGRRALPARLHQPRHSSPTRSDASSASLQARSSEAKRQGQPHLSPLPRSRSDRQDSSHPAAGA
jgi:hypothetical protein